MLSIKTADASTELLAVLTTCMFPSASAQNEKLFGMGQYQQDDLDLKYTTLELAHRNSQASVPFVLSSLAMASYGITQLLVRLHLEKM